MGKNKRGRNRKCQKQGKKSCSKTHYNQWLHRDKFANKNQAQDAIKRQYSESKNNLLDSKNIMVEIKKVIQQAGQKVNLRKLLRKQNKKAKLINNQRAIEIKLKNCFRIQNIQMIGVEERKNRETKREIIKEIKFPECEDLSHHIERSHGVLAMKMNKCHYKI